MYVYNAYTQRMPSVHLLRSKTEHTQASQIHIHTHTPHIHIWHILYPASVVTRDYDIAIGREANACWPPWGDLFAYYGIERWYGHVPYTYVAVARDWGEDCGDVRRPLYVWNVVCWALYVCMYVCMYVYVYVCVHLYAWTYVRMYTIHAYTTVWRHICA